MTISRRNLIATAAAVSSAAALPALPALAMESTTVALVEAHLAAVAEVNKSPFPGDDAMNAAMNEIERRYVRPLQTASVRTPQDAHAAMEWLVDQGVDLDELFGDLQAKTSFERAATNLARGLRAYLAAQA